MPTIEVTGISGQQSLHDRSNRECTRLQQ
jgi:hypothetical protein